MIRPGRDGDAPGYIALISACWAEYGGIVTDVNADLPGIHALATTMAARGGAVWTAEDGGTVVGMIATYPADDGWHLSRVYVAAGHRGTGLGHALIAGAEEFARAAGAVRMVLWTDVLFTRAHAFYEKLGYLRSGGIRALKDTFNSIEARYAKPLVGRVVEELDVAGAESAERALAVILQEVAASGASMMFRAPLGRDKALAYWRGVTQVVGRGEARLFAGWRNGALSGALQLGLAMPEAQSHRAEITNLMIAPGGRCQGVARALLAAAEDAARQAGRRLLVMQGRADAHTDGLYTGLGWVAAGTVPEWAVGGCGMTTYYKARVN